MRKFVVDTYECEICGTHYATRAQAAECEAAGRPGAAFREGDAVAFRPGAAPDALRDERFKVETSLVTLAEPAWAECEEGAGAPRHIVSYILQNHLGQVGFIAQHQLETIE